MYRAIHFSVNCHSVAYDTLYAYWCYIVKGVPVKLCALRERGNLYGEEFPRALVKDIAYKQTKGVLIRMG